MSAKPINAKPMKAGEPQAPTIDAFRSQHLDVAERQIAPEYGRSNVTIDESESPLAWLARRRGRNGRALIEPHQFQAGERLRADFTWAKADRRNEFLRAKLNAQGGLDLFPNQGSAVLTSTVWGDGLVDNPPGNPIAPGDLVRFIPFSELMY